MKLLLIDSLLSGHHLNYLKLTLTAFIADGHECDILLQKKQVTKEIESSLYNLGVKKIHLIDLKDTPEKVLKRFHWFGLQIYYFYIYRKLLPKIIKAQNIDKVWFCTIDNLFHVWGLLGSPTRKTPASGLCMQQRVGLREMGIDVQQEKYPAIKRALFLRTLKSSSLSSMCTILKPTYDYIESEFPTLKQKFFYVADPIHIPSRIPRNEALTMLGLKDETCLIVVYGSIYERKGVFDLLKAMQSKNWPLKARIIFAGKQHENTRNRILDEYASELKTAKLQVIDRFLTSEEEKAIYSITDLMWVGYSKGFAANSGVLLQAVASGIPVVGNDHGMIGDFLRKNKNVGYIVNTTNPQEIAKTVTTFTKDKWIIPEKTSKRVLAEHSKNSFQSSLVQTLTINYSIQ